MKQPDFSIEFDLDNFPASFCALTDRSDDDVGVSLHSKGASKGVGQLMTSHGNTHKGMKTQAQDAHSFTCVSLALLRSLQLTHPLYCFHRKTDLQNLRLDNDMQDNYSRNRKREGMFTPYLREAIRKHVNLKAVAHE